MKRIKNYESSGSWALYLIIAICLGLFIASSIVYQPKTFIVLFTDIRTIIGFIARIISNYYFMFIEMLFLFYMIKKTRLEDVEKGNLKYNLIFFTILVLLIGIYINYKTFVP